MKRATSSKASTAAKDVSGRDGPRKRGQPLHGAQPKIRTNVMLDPDVAARLRELGGGNLSRGIDIAAKRSQEK